MLTKIYFQEIPGDSERLVFITPDVIDESALPAKSDCGLIIVRWEMDLHNYLFDTVDI